MVYVYKGGLPFKSVTWYMLKGRWHESDMGLLVGGNCDKWET